MNIIFNKMNNIGIIGYENVKLELLKERFLKFLIVQGIVILE